jgi:hypothetical protein
MQEGKAKKLQLSVDVLDDVLNELQSLQDVDIRPAVQQIRSLEKEELMALGVLVMSNRRINFDQAWYLEVMFKEETQWTKKSLQEKLDVLVSRQLVKYEDNILTFAGDEFDRVYCKYYSRKEGVVASISEMSFSFRLRFGIEVIARVTESKIVINGWYGEYIEEQELETLVGNFTNQKFDLFEQNVMLAEVLYRANLDNQDMSKFPFISLTLRTPWEKIQAWYTVENPSPDFTADTYLDEFGRIFRSIKDRASENDSEFSIKVFFIAVLPIDNIVRGIASINSQNLKSNIADIHLHKMYDIYTDAHDLAEAKYHGELALLFEPEPADVEAANNLGYLFMSIRELEEAKKLFEIAEKRLKILPVSNTFVLFPHGFEEIASENHVVDPKSWTDFKRHLGGS